MTAAKKTTPKKKAAPKRRVGRPSAYTQKVADEICRRLSLGETLIGICRDNHMPHRDSVHTWAETIPEFSDKYARARIAQTRSWADEIVSIADSVQEDYLRDADGNPVLKENGDPIFIKERPHRTAQRIDVRKWLMTKINLEEFGERIAHSVQHSYADREDAEILAEVHNALSEAGLSVEDVMGWLQGPVQ